MAENITLTPESLNEAFTTYREELLEMPMFSLSSLLPYLSLRKGVRGKEGVGELTGEMEIGPYSSDYVDEDGIGVNYRFLETYNGNTTKRFKPNTIARKILGSEHMMPSELKSLPLTYKVWTYLMKKMSESVYNSAFTAVRNPLGHKTKDLFDGYITIADKEKAAGKISAENGNYFKIPETITDVNACDVLESIYDAACEKLQDQETYMFMSRKTKQLYEKNYKVLNGSLVYNTEYKKSFLDADVDKHCELVGLSCIPAGHVILTTRGNLLLGTALTGTDTRFEILNASNHWDLDFLAALWLGAEFESINKERLVYAKVEEVV